MENQFATLRHLVDVEERVTRHHRAKAQADSANLSTAENVLLFDFYQKHLFDWTAREPIGVDDLRYPTQIYGSASTQQSWAKFLNQAWGEDLVSDADVYAVGGTSAALECLAFILGQPGEAVISPAPLWYGFPWCFTQRPKLSFVPFDLTEKGIDAFTLTLEDVQRAYRAVRPAPKFLVLTNPVNPTGGNYPVETLNAIYQWVLAETDMHIVSDEIYFSSQVGGGEAFVPAFKLDAVKQAGDVGRERVHAVWGLAKDFGMSGFKVGFVISRNSQVHAMMKGSSETKTMAWFTPYDSLKQYTLGPLFLSADGQPDPALAQEAMRLYAGSEAGALLREQYDATRTALDDGKIKYYGKNQAAIFFWLDLREFLDKVPKAESENGSLHPDIDPREEALASYISDNAAVSLIPGQECFCREPGFFRLCYTAEPKATVVAGIGRMAKALAALK